MRKSDKSALLHWIDVPAAFGLLTRIPLRLNTAKVTARGGSSAWAFPIVGVFIGLVAAAVTAAVHWIGLPSAVAAIFAVLVPVIITGAMHEDGLADTADGFWGGWDKERSLEIMKDSHIGTYGTLAIGLSLLLRGVLITALVSDEEYMQGLILAAMMSRASMAGLLTFLPNARGVGLSSSYGRPSNSVSLLAMIICICTALIIIPSHAVSITLVALISTILCGLYAKSKIGGQTGDVLGATQQVTEIAVLFTLLAEVGF